MRRRSLAHRLAAAIFVLCGSAFGGGMAEGAPVSMVAASALVQGETSKVSLTITVLGRTSSGNAVKRARVVLTLPDESEVKGVTNASGEASFKGLPLGTIKVQVRKTGWETAGVALELASSAETLEVVLKADAPPTP